jgi:hypothetical protein
MRGKGCPAITYHLTYYTHAYGIEGLIFRFTMFDTSMLRNVFGGRGGA